MTPNQEIRGIVATGANVLPQRVIEDAFRDQYGHTLNFGRFSSALKELNGWYEDRGIYGQVNGVVEPVWPCCEAMQVAS